MKEGRRSGCPSGRPPHRSSRSGSASRRRHPRVSRGGRGRRDRRPRRRGGRRSATRQIFSDRSRSAVDPEGGPRWLEGALVFRGGGRQRSGEAPGVLVPFHPWEKIARPPGRRGGGCPPTCTRSLCTSCPACSSPYTWCVWYVRDVVALVLAGAVLEAGPVSHFVKRLACLTHTEGLTRWLLFGAKGKEYWPRYLLPTSPTAFWGRVKAGKTRGRFRGVPFQRCRHHRVASERKRPTRGEPGVLATNLEKKSYRKASCRSSSWLKMLFDKYVEAHTVGETTRC